MVKRHSFSYKSIQMFEPLAFDHSQYSQEYNTYINRPVFEPNV